MDNWQQQQMWQDACAAAIASLPVMTPARLSALLFDAAPDAVWQMLATNKPLPVALGATRVDEKMIGRWQAMARKTEPLEVLERYRSRDIGVWSRYGNYPARLTADEHAPSVLFYQGDVDALCAPTVAIIGTRHCTAEGRAHAATFGQELSEAGVSVVSGLALGIDGAAHEGVLRAVDGAPPIGVVGSGLDIEYPKRHRGLWHNVRRSGLLISESPLGATPEPWRFPARNRIIAGLADLVLVVESHDTGGSLLTVDQALERDVSVMAVPGSIRSPASRGSNRLLGEGAVPACSTRDVLDLLRWNASGRSSPREVDEPEEGTDMRPQVLPNAADLPVLEAVGFTSTSTDEILETTCLSLGEVAVALTRLQAIGLVVGEAGWWYRSQGSDGFGGAA